MVLWSQNIQITQFSSNLRKEDPIQDLLHPGKSRGQFVIFCRFCTDGTIQDWKKRTEKPKASRFARL
jgi:hypothetical protein